MRPWWSVLLLPSVAFAADPPVSVCESGGGEIRSVCPAPQCDFQDLQAAIDASEAGDRLYVSPKGLNQSWGQIAVDDDLCLVAASGPERTRLNAGSTTPALIVGSGANVALFGFELLGSPAQPAAIVADGHLALGESRVLVNGRLRGGGVRVDEGSTAIYRTRISGDPGSANLPGWTGGGLYAAPGTSVWLAESVFESLRACGGGAAHFDGVDYLGVWRVRVKDTGLHYCDTWTTPVGAGFYLQDVAEYEIVEGHFSGTSSASTWGGALALDASEGRVERSVFEDIQSGIYGTGGGIAAHAGSLELIDSALRRNASGTGGALYADQVALTVRGSVFQGNQAAELGGAIAITAPDDLDPAPKTDVSASQFMGNKGGFGGAISVQSVYPVKLTGNAFFQNEALGYTGHPEERGGALYLTRTVDALVDQNVLCENQGDLGSAIWAMVVPSQTTHPGLVLRGNVIARNSGVAAPLYLPGTTLTATQNSLLYNPVTSATGALTPAIVKLFSASSNDPRVRGFQNNVLLRGPGGINTAPLVVFQSANVADHVDASGFGGSTAGQMFIGNHVRNTVDGVTVGAAFNTPKLVTGGDWVNPNDVTLCTGPNLVPPQNLGNYRDAGVSIPVVVPGDAGTPDIGAPAWLNPSSSAYALLDHDTDGIREVLDCDDADKEIRPGATERCDTPMDAAGIDADCDRLPDWHPDEALSRPVANDGDRDGYPVGAGVDTAFCGVLPLGRAEVDLDGDCDDFNYAISPGETEVPYNGIDEDCDPGTDDADADGDGAPGDPALSGSDGWDCDDEDPSVGPDQVEEPYNGADDDCDAATRDDDLDADGFPKANDCADGDAAVNPGKAEVPYNGKDDDCKPATPDDDLDGDGVIRALDCDDADAERSPELDERTYNGVDDDCDPATRDDDLDADGVDADEDCDDADRDTFPGADELCDGLDNDCDEAVDEESVVVSWYADLDGDGAGDADDLVASCAPQDGRVTVAGDCDDGDPALKPGASEACDGIDEDCDGVIDEDATDATVFYADGDGDGAGDAANPVSACALPEGAAVDAGDCADADPERLPGAEERCNAEDDDCDGAVDEEIVFRDWFLDADGDGRGDPASGLSACDAPEGRVRAGGDCDDADPLRYPDAPEACDGADQDCDAEIDEDLTFLTRYDDLDGDGYGDAATAQESCAVLPDTVTVAGDCDDAVATTYPGSVEVAGNGVDDDCDGESVDLDQRVAGGAGCDTTGRAGLLAIGLAGLLSRRRRR